VDTFYSAAAGVKEGEGKTVAKKRTGEGGREKVGCLRQRGSTSLLGRRRQERVTLLSLRGDTGGGENTDPCPKTTEGREGRMDPAWDA